MMHGGAGGRRGTGHMEFQQILRRHADRYPRMTPQDYGKLAYQSEFGPEHMCADGEHALRFLLEEWRDIPPDGPPQPPETIGNGLSRFHLDRVWKAEEAAPLLAELFCRTAGEHAGTREGLAEKLGLLRRQGVPGMDAWLDEWEQAGCPPVHHSPDFREAYRPRYRVLGADYADYFPALLAVWKLVQAGRPAIAAIDGRCGSGKTGLAALIARVFPCSVVHMDDYYLPPAQRSAAWEQTPGGNMDFARILEEVLQPAGRGEAICCRPFSCHAGRLGKAFQLPPRPLTVVEGSYSHHPLLTARYGLRIFLTCSKKEQARRLKAREGDSFPAFQHRWIPMEERYLASCGVEQSAGLTLDTSRFF